MTWPRCAQRTGTRGRMHWHDRARPCHNMVGAQRERLAPIAHGWGVITSYQSLGTRVPKTRWGMGLEHALLCIMCFVLNMCDCVL